MNEARPARQRGAAFRTPVPVQVRETVSVGSTTIEIVGSDRDKQIVMGRCPLCGHYRQFVLGHIAPRWAAAWSKAEGTLVARYDSIGARTRVQDYTKHYTFCQPCDQFLGEAERYLASLVKGTARDLEAVKIRLFPRAGEVVLAGLNVKKIFRALCGIALKIHLSNAQMYASHALKAQSARDIVAALQADDYPSDTFAAVGYKLVNRLVRGANPRATLIMEIRRSHGADEVHIQMAGWRFVLVCGSPESWRAAERFQPRNYIGEETYWATAVVEWADEFGGAAMREPLTTCERTIEASEMCPCGLNLRFSDCCSGRWLPADTKWLLRPYRQVVPTAG